MTGKTAKSNTGEWNYPALLVALLGAVVLQSIFLPCLCREGMVKMQIALAADLFVLARLVIARLRRERGKGWMFYAALPYAIIPVAMIAVRFWGTS